jgi:hypothetical protein
MADLEYFVTSKFSGGEGRCVYRKPRPRLFS